MSNIYGHEQVVQLVHDFINNTIKGYSLYLVNGRYRADALAASRTSAMQRAFASGRYLIDETTAVVRFILPFETKDIVLTQIGQSEAVIHFTSRFFDLMKEGPKFQNWNWAYQFWSL